MSSRVNIYSVILIFILFYAFLIRIFNINYNSPFLDEAIYIVLGKKILDTRVAEVAQSISWVGGFPFFYPFLSALFFAIGGIVASRIFNVILGTVSVFLIYEFTRKLNLADEKKTMMMAPLFAAALVGTSAIPIAFSRLAIYDTLSILLFILGLTTLTAAIFEGEKKWYLTSAFILFAAFLAKYIVFIYFPFLLLLTLYLAFRTNKKEAVMVIIKFFWLPLTGATLLYFLLNARSLSEFIADQAIKENSQAGEIFSIFARYTYIAFVLAFGGLFFLRQRKAYLLGLVLMAGAIVPLFFHLAASESLSAGQHSAYSLVFLAPIAGLFFAMLTVKFKQFAIILSTIAIFINLISSLGEVRNLGSFWPNTIGAATVLKDNVKVEDRVLAESGDAIYIELYDQLPSENFFGPYVFSYKNEEGTSAYYQAIADGYFNYIELDKSSFPEEIHAGFSTIIDHKYFSIFDDQKVKVYKLKS